MERITKSLFATYISYKSLVQRRFVVIEEGDGRRLIDPSWFQRDMMTESSGEFDTWSLQLDFVTTIAD